jgi:hypothetical protein
VTAILTSSLANIKKSKAVEVKIMALAWILKIGILLLLIKIIRELNHGNIYQDYQIYHSLRYVSEKNDSNGLRDAQKFNLIIICFIADYLNLFIN